MSSIKMDDLNSERKNQHATPKTAANKKGVYLNIKLYKQNSIWERFNPTLLQGACWRNKYIIQVVEIGAMLGEEKNEEKQ